MNFRILAAPIVLVPAYFRGRRASAEIYAADYDKRAATYDSAKGRQEMQAVSEKLLSRLPSISPSRILDLGCGTGHISKSLAERFPEAAVEGVDVSESMLKEARRKSSGLPNVTFHCCGMDDFLRSADPSQYDLITCMWAIGYARPPQILRLIARTLTFDGSVLVTVNTRQSLAEIQNLYARILLRHPFYLERVPIIGFPRSRRQFVRWIRLAGLKESCLDEGRFTLQFADGREFVEWLRTAGQSAGLESSMCPDCREAIFREIQHLVGCSPLSVTHRYLEFVGRRNKPNRQ